MILRPYLNEFLSKMKKFYELLLFSFGTPDYVNPLIDRKKKKNILNIDYIDTCYL